LHALIEEAVRTPDRPEGSELQQIADFYLSYMDTARVEALGLQPLTADLARIDAIASHDDLMRYLAYARRIEVAAPFNFYIAQDARNASAYIPYVVQAGLGLPDRDFYFDERFAELRSRYTAHVARLLDLAGLPGGDAAARQIVDLETRLAQHHWTRVQSRDANATYNNYDLAGAGALAPNLDWQTYFAEAGIPQIESFIISQPSFFQALDTILTAVPVPQWK